MNNVVELKVGCGKYIQGNNVLQRIGNILKNFSNRVLIIGGSTTTDIVMDKVETVIKESGLIYEVIRHEGTCSRSSALDYANKAQKEKYGVLMGIGGGKLMDLVKAVSYYSRLPVVNVPTSIATCAAVSAVCIMYTDEGKPDGSISMKKEVDCVVADTNIIAQSPKRLIAAGIFDSLAKLPEVLHGLKIASYKDCPLTKYIAYANSSVIYNYLYDNGKTIYDNPADSNLLDDVVLINLLLTSVVSGFSSGLNQLALAHGLYDAARKLFYFETKEVLHGEIVAVGILMQMSYNECKQKEIDKFRELMLQLNVPTTLSQIGIPCNGESLQIIKDYLVVATGLDSEEKIEKLDSSIEQVID